MYVYVYMCTLDRHNTFKTRRWKHKSIYITYIINKRIS